MDVARASAGTQGFATNSYSTSIAHDTFTVSAGADFLLVGLVFDDSGDLNLPSGITVNWDALGTPQPMTEVGTVINGSMKIVLYGLKNPTAGTKRLAASWTHSSPYCIVLAAFTNTHATTPYVPEDTKTNTGSSTSPSTTAVTRSASGATFGFCGTVDQAGGSVNFTATGGGFTEEYRHTTDNEAAGAASTGLTGTSNNHSWTTSESNLWAAIGIHIQAAGAAPVTVLAEESWYTLEPQTNPSVISVW